MGEGSKLSDGGLGSFPFFGIRFSLFQNANFETSGFSSFGIDGMASFGSDGLGSVNGIDLQPVVPRIATAIKPAVADRAKRGRNDFETEASLGSVERFGVGLGRMTSCLLHF